MFTVSKLRSPSPGEAAIKQQQQQQQQEEEGGDGTGVGTAPTRHPTGTLAQPTTTTNADSSSLSLSVDMTPGALWNKTSTAKRSVLNHTPSTEASSPSPSFSNLGGHGDINNESGDHGDVVLVDKDGDEKPRAMHDSHAADDSDEDSDDDDEVPPVPPALSQTDQQVYDLDRGGALKEVIGSQSVLSQELILGTQDSGNDDGGDHGGGRGGGGGGNDDAMNGQNLHLDDEALALSQETEDSIAMATRLGLLGSTQDEDEDDEVEYDSSNSNNNKGFAEPDGDEEQARHHPPNTPVSSKFKFKSQDISDTPVRESEGFGSLLDAVAKIAEEEEVHMMSWGGGHGNPKMERTSLQDPPTIGTTSAGLPVRTSARKRKPSPKIHHSRLSEEEVLEAEKLNSKPNLFSRKTTGTVVAASSAAVLAKPPTVTKKSTKPSSSGSGSNAKVTATTATSVKRKQPPEAAKFLTVKQKKEADTREAQAIAQRAAALAERTITDPVIAKKLLLSMALVRENPRSPPEVLPGPGHELQEGFFWAHYPPLEAVLKTHMAEYYELSTNKCQSAQQQAFNNSMVEIAKEVAENLEWKFAPCFDDKALRDRIRCYYKTHIQNAKKRLRTMVRNPTKRANARHLCDHLDIIEGLEVAGSKKVEPNSIKRQRKEPTKTIQRHGASHGTSAPPRTLAHGRAPISNGKDDNFEAAVLAKVNAIIPPGFSPTRNTSRSNGDVGGGTPINYE